MLKLQGGCAPNLPFRYPKPLLTLFFTAAPAELDKCLGSPGARAAPQMCETNVQLHPQSSSGGPGPNLSYSGPSPWRDAWRYLETSWLGPMFADALQPTVWSLHSVWKASIPWQGLARERGDAILERPSSAQEEEEARGPFWRSLGAGGRLSPVWGRVTPVLGVSGALERHCCHCKCGLYHCEANMVPDHKYGPGRVSDSRALSHAERHRPGAPRLGARSPSPRWSPPPANTGLPPASQHGGHPQRASTASRWQWSPEGCDCTKCSHAGGPVLCPPSGRAKRTRGGRGSAPQLSLDPSTLSFFSPQGLTGQALAARGGFLADLGWEAARRRSAQPSPSASRWPERSPSLGGGRCRGNSTSAGANLLLQEFPEKFPLRADLSTEP